MIGPQELAFLGQGLMWTLALTAIGFTGGILFGFLVALARVSPIRWISALAAGWSLKRLPRVDRNVMRIAVYEIDHTGVPDAVAVSEAIGLVSQLSTDDSPSFVNGVLGTVVETKASRSMVETKDEQATPADAEAVPAARRRFSDAASDGAGTLSSRSPVRP